jgi:hypothetical protein
MCKQRMLGAQPLDEPSLAFSREISIAGELAPRDRLLEEAQLTPSDRWTIEGDGRCHSNLAKRFEGQETGAL